MAPPTLPLTVAPDAAVLPSYTLLSVPPIDADDELSSGRWIELTYQAPESLVKVTVNLSDEPQEALGLGPWESRYTAE